MSAWKPSEQQVADAAAEMYTRGSSEGRRTWRVGYDGPDTTQRLWIAMADHFLRSATFAEISDDRQRSVMPHD